MFIPRWIDSRDRRKAAGNSPGTHDWNRALRIIDRTAEEKIEGELRASGLRFKS